MSVLERLELAKPGIPVEKPQRREKPDIVNPNPVPQRLPAEPVKVPREPAPVPSTSYEII